jgi:glycine cleavage system regulatory protein
MTTLVLTIVGADRAGLVAEVADIVAHHGGNWERSELAELSGAFAGIVEVFVPSGRADELSSALGVLDGILTVSVHHAADASADDTAQRDDSAQRVVIDVIGNDHPGIVREITGVLREHGLSIDRMTTETRDAAMSGGRLFEASVVARVAASVDLEAVSTELERLAAEIRVDVTLAG